MNIKHVIAVALVAGALGACSSDKDNGALNGNGTGTGDAAGGYGAGGGGIQSGDIATLTTELKTQAGDTIRFGYDSSEISGEAREILQRQSAFASKYQNLAFTIEGHCDERGTREYNLALGERRATAAKSALITLGVSGQRLKTISYGKERPVAVGSNESAWAQNRRAVTVIE
jgi:peptidoglycan-associated lipoprotein